MKLPTARGPVSARLLDGLRAGDPATGPEPDLPADLLGDDDAQLALWTCYELHYRGFEDVADDLEWDPWVLAFRARLEEHLERELRTACADPADDAMEPARVPAALAAVVADDGPPLSRFLMRQADAEQFRRFVRLRSVYHLKEADPHSWAIPRLGGPTKSALIEIQSDEYGNGRPGLAHCELFAATMRELGLDDGYGRYLDEAPGWTLAVSNVISWLGLHRRLRGALVGHLAAFEMTSSLPNRRYGNGLRRLGFGPAATRFYDEHVEADAVHEQLAMHQLCGSLALAEPALAGQILFGARCCLYLDDLFARRLLASFDPAGAVEPERADPVGVAG